VRIDRVTGPTELESSDGGVVLAGVRAPLHASTRSGAITASFSPVYGRTGASAGSDAESAVTELASVQGDITVFLPRRMALTIDAQVGQGGDHRIVADPSVPLRIRNENSANGRVLHGQCELNGGGRVLHLRTASGNIRLRLVDAGPDQDASAPHEPPLGVEPGQIGANDAGVAVSAAPGPEAGGADANADAPSAFEELRRRFEGFWSSAISVAPEEEQRHLVHSVAPEYPEIARQAGVEGDVTMRVVIGKDGAVADVAALSGDPVLARAAMEAVEHWSYAPALLGGRPIGVVTTVTLAFRLR
jgi:TonB family protein